jgi:hypothetical protein
MHAIIMSNYVRDDYSTDDTTESNTNYVELEGDMSVLKKLHQMITTTLKWMQMTIVFNGKNKTKRGTVKSSTHLHCRRQNILTKLLRVIGQTKNATLPFEA